MGETTWVSTTFWAPSGEHSAGVPLPVLSPELGPKVTKLLWGLFDLFRPQKPDGGSSSQTPPPHIPRQEGGPFCLPAHDHRA